MKTDNENKYLPIKNHSNFGICNFANIVKCNFKYSVPIVSHQLIKANYTMYHHLSPTPININLTLVKQLIKNKYLHEILKEIKNNRKQVLIMFLYHDAKKN